MINLWCGFTFKHVFNSHISSIVCVCPKSFWSPCWRFVYTPVTTPKHCSAVFFQWHKSKQTATAAKLHNKKRLRDRRTQEKLNSCFYWLSKIFSDIQPQAKLPLNEVSSLIMLKSFFFLVRVQVFLLAVTQRGVSVLSAKCLLWCFLLRTT